MVFNIFLLNLHPQMRRTPIIPVIIGTGFGSGFWPWGPGTAGALLATLIWIGLSYLIVTPYLTCITALLIATFTVLGIWATSKLMPFWGDDPNRVVIDEMVGVWIPLLVSPAGDLYYAIGSFLLFRFFDILKPLGIRRIDNCRGAFYVMADDIVAGIYSLVIISIARWVI